MKKLTLLFIAIFLHFNSYAQITFEKGYYIDNLNQKVNCYIKNIDWDNTPSYFEYKTTLSSPEKTIQVQSVKEFAIIGQSKYIRSLVEIDRSSSSLKHISNNKEPIFKKESLFLKVLVAGKASLYFYKDNNLRRYFYSKDDSQQIKQLIYKPYRISENKIRKNNTFKRQLWLNLKCDKFTISKINQIQYKKNQLTNFFIKYNKCNDPQFKSFKKAKNGDLFNFNVKVGLNNASLTISKDEKKYTDIKNTSNIRFGIETEFILPFNKNKWALAIEPSYQSFKSNDMTGLDADFVSGKKIVTKIDYKVIEVPFSLRHYLFLKNKSALFVNLSYVLNFDIDSSLEFFRKDGSRYLLSEIASRNNFSLGIGYKYRRYSAELRYQGNRSILGNSISFNSNYSALLFTLGYTLF
ncbi:tRNA modification GTPase [Tenacibaculum maritimum]|uniref:tRNA modification GTPase n=3 Tax=Tenacibaculum maritimum TaxID=107401 RepID=UPI002307CD6F|nr:tRNA modification GTPase [Tenacibaculum maritimum]MDB0599582.1 tRNA modification GTPase [Tenacibaculum maritimum]MDB0602063.1 tRNA modification GTPase [Tenacibaculum maritimum]MDB0613170.1 tRNA modification GTPase [Tenacibaculum maritimum]